MIIYIYTINDDRNYGNRLQNYSTEYILNKYCEKVKTLYIYKNYTMFKNIIKNLINYDRLTIKDKVRKKNFHTFNKKYIVRKFVNYKKIGKLKYDYIVAGSDQIWNYNFNSDSFINFLMFSERKHNISFAASFGISNISQKFKSEYKNGLNNFKNISVREDTGKIIVEDLTDRKDVEVLVDPTMLLTASEWDKVSIKPKMLKSKKFILNYFLGNLSESRKNEINRVARENDCEVINILDKNSPFYECGPSEFLYLEKHAFLICTDSFHSSVFGIIYNTPFLVFDREDKEVSMNSRLETLLSKFKMEDRKYTGKIRKKDLKIDCTNAYEILEVERKKSEKFLKKALDIKDSE